MIVGKIQAKEMREETRMRGRGMDAEAFEFKQTKRGGAMIQVRWDNVSHSACVYGVD